MKDIVESIIYNSAKDGDGWTLTSEKVCKELRKYINKQIKEIKKFESDSFRVGQIDMLMQIRDSLK